MKNKTQDLSRLINPGSVAIIGASRNPAKSGHVLVKNIVELGYPGKIFPINPNADEILGLKAYRSVKDVPDDIDQAIIAIPAEFSIETLKECGEKHIPFAVIISSGFSEEGNSKFQKKMIQTARKARIRILGPNTTGLLNVRGQFLGSFMPMVRIPIGGVAFIAQTGMFAGYILAHILSSESFGIDNVIGIGNKSDLDDWEILNHFRHEEEIRVVAMYIEGIKSHRFFEEAKQTSMKKPIIFFKSGVTRSGARTMRYHTGSTNMKDSKFASHCAQAGLVQVESFEEMMHLVRGFALQPLPMSNRIAVMSNTGAGCVVTADYCEKEGLVLAKLSASTMNAIRDITPKWHRLTNPLDLYPSIEQHGVDKAYSVAIDATMRDQTVGAIIALFGLVPLWKLPTEISILTGATKVTKPVLMVGMGDEGCIQEMRRVAGARRIPFFTDAKAATYTLAKMWGYNSWLKLHKADAKLRSMAENS